MLHSFKGAFGLFAIFAVAGLVLPAQAANAATPGPTVSLSAFTHATTVPNTRIKDSGTSVVFDPTSLSTVWSGPTSKTCTSNRQMITITNKTSKNKKITYDGKVIGLLPAGDKGGICFWGTGSEQFVFGIKKSTSQLTVSVT
jgi:hypothetical protein